jgi:uncharacterized protein (TIGR02266 family)
VPQKFSIYFVWEAGSPPADAAKFVEALAETIPGTKVDIRVALRPELACLALDLDFTLYARSTIEDWDAKAVPAGGRLIELMRIPVEQREEFKLRFLWPAKGEPAPFESFRAAATAIRGHLGTNVATSPAAPSGGEAAPSPAPLPAKPARGIDARTATRHEVFLGVEFKTGEEFAREYATNISKGGLFIRTDKKPALNAEAMLTLHLPSGESLRTIVRVVHASDAGIGVAFSAVDAAFDAALKRYLATLPGAR